MNHPTDTGTNQSLRIVQLNIGSLFEPNWEERRHEIVAWIEHLSPDVMCFEEVRKSDAFGNSAEWIAENLMERQPEVAWHWRYGGDRFESANEHSSLTFGSAIFSRWPIDTFAYSRLPLGLCPDPVAQQVPWELIHAFTAGLDIFATHLSAAPQQGLHRQAQVAFIDRYVRDIQGTRDGAGPARSSMPPILCGDFNAEPDSDEIRFLCGLTALNNKTTFWQDAWRVAAEREVKSESLKAPDRAGFTNDWTRNPLAASMNVHRKRIDYVFVGDPFYRPGSGGRVLKADVVFDEPLTGILASDHFGLCVDVQWPDRPIGPS